MDIEILIFLLVTLLASYFQSITGFGQGLIAAPVTFILFDKNMALTALIVVGIAINLYLVITIRARLRGRILLLLLLGGIPGLPLGLVIARSISLPALQLTVGVVAIVSVLALMFYKIRIHKRPLYSVIAGFVSGILQTSTALSGPPVILLLTEENTAKQTMRKLLPAYFIIMGSITTVMFIPAGLLDIKGVIVGLSTIPLVLLAGYLGNDESKRINQKTYRTLTMGVILITGLTAIYEGLPF